MQRRRLEAGTMSGGVMTSIRRHRGCRGVALPRRLGRERLCALWGLSACPLVGRKHRCSGVLNVLDGGLCCGDRGTVHANLVLFARTLRCRWEAQFGHVSACSKMLGSNSARR
ncbi:unnamed protein product, partial [Ectocarpus sp. 12 AP-2014]